MIANKRKEKKKMLKSKVKKLWEKTVRYWELVGEMDEKKQEERSILYDERELLNTEINKEYNLYGVNLFNGIIDKLAMTNRLSKVGETPTHFTLETAIEVFKSMGYEVFNDDYLCKRAREIAKELDKELSNEDHNILVGDNTEEKWMVFNGSDYENDLIEFIEENQDLETTIWEIVKETLLEPVEDEEDHTPDEDTAFPNLRER